MLPTTSQVTRVKLIVTEGCRPRTDCGMHCRLRVGRKTGSSEPEVVKRDRRSSAPWPRRDAQVPLACSSTGTTFAQRRQCWIDTIHTYRSTRRRIAHVSVKLHRLYLDWMSSCSWLTGGSWSGCAPANEHPGRDSSRSKLSAATNEWTSFVDRRHRRGGARVAVCEGPAARAMRAQSVCKRRPLLALLAAQAHRRI